MYFRAFCDGLLRKHSPLIRQIHRRHSNGAACPRSYVRAIVEVFCADPLLGERIINHVLHRFPNGAKRGIIVWEVIGHLPSERIIGTCDARVREYAAQDPCFDLDLAIECLGRYANRLWEQADRSYQNLCGTYSYTNPTPYELQAIRQDVFREEFAVPLQKYVQQLICDFGDGMIAVTDTPRSANSAPS